MGQEVSWTQMTSVADLGCFSRIPAPIFSIPVPGVKKAPDPGSGSATLQITYVNLFPRCLFLFPGSQRHHLPDVLAAHLHPRPPCPADGLSLRSHAVPHRRAGAHHGPRPSLGAGGGCRSVRGRKPCGHPLSRPGKLAGRGGEQPEEEPQIPGTDAGGQCVPRLPPGTVDRKRKYFRVNFVGDGWLSCWRACLLLQQLSGFESRHLSLSKKYGRHKQKSGQHTVARPKFRLQRKKRIKEGECGTNEKMFLLEVQNSRNIRSKCAKKCRLFMFGKF